MNLTVVFYRDEAGEYRWRARAANNRIVATSGEGYENKADRDDIANALFLSENTVVIVNED